MSVYWLTEKVHQFKRKFVESVLSRVTETVVRQALDGFTTRQRVYESWTLFRTLLCQVAAGNSCRQAIERAIQQGWVPSTTSVKNGSYCNARARLPEEPLKRLAMGLGTTLEAEASKKWLALGRPVKVADGTGVRLPDSEANQRAYPQPSGQKPGCGFPVMYLCALMGLASGAILDAVTGTAGKEHPLFRRLWRSLREGDILLADAGLCSYAEIALLLQAGVDCLVRLRRRKFDPRKANRIGKGDWLTQWKCPRSPGKWVLAGQLPQRLVMRIVRFRVEVKGFRTREVMLATTLVDAKRYPKRELVKLYRRRWEMELRLRDIKTTMGLEVLRCKSPCGSRKELWMGLMAYNMIRTVMIDAARRGRLSPARISFAGTVQRLAEVACGRLMEQSPHVAYCVLLDHLAEDRLPRRANRVEPRKIKLRPKQYSRLTEPRTVWKERALAA